MEETESQIAKIQLGNNKTSNTYVFVGAEKAQDNPAELYMIAEMPLFNPAAEESCENMSLAIFSALKRAYRRQPNENSFENAISQINEELGKLAEMGQTQWINKLNCIVAVRHENNFSISTCGKVSAFLLRNKEFTDISCSQNQPHPLKTFENFANGKIRLGDLVILSTTQLFNHISMDRLLEIISGTGFLTATQTIIELLKKNADPQTSFGVILNLQVPAGQAVEEEPDLENYIVERQSVTVNLWKQSLSYIKSIFALDKNHHREPKVSLPKISLANRVKGLASRVKNLFSKSGYFIKNAKNSAGSMKQAVNSVNLTKFKALSKPKQILTISVIVLLVAALVNVGIALKLKSSSKANQEITNQLKETQSLLSNAQSALLYKDEVKAGEYFNQASAKLPAQDKINSSNKALYEQVSGQFNEVKDLMEKNIAVNTENLGSLSQADILLKISGYLATQANNAVVSYDINSGKIEDGKLSLPTQAVAEVNIGKNSAVIYDGEGLYVWDYSAGKFGQAFSQSVPQKEDFGGMAFYPTNSRVYIVDKKSGAIISYLVNGTSISKPVVSVRDPSLNSSVGIAIDGSIYVLTASGLNKYQSGKLADFSLPALPKAFSGKGKIYTQKEFANIYILDVENNRVLVIDKKGVLVHTLKSENFSNLKDFSVDETGKLMFVLNENSLLKAQLP